MPLTAASLTIFFSPETISEGLRPAVASRVVACDASNTPGTLPSCDSRATRDPSYGPQRRDLDQPTRPRSR